ncbi:MAG: DNA-directed RNA polymerase subunit omega [Bacteroidales bacterium]|jgi:DNA-directed RNA polymerase subunit K/omega|nr:DNA-directed RNA polymerase subunit omega [Bacteroidales bacterium]
MDYKRTKADKTTQTRNIGDFNALTDNIYETISMLSKRSNQISQDLKHEFHQKVEEYTNPSDNLEEVFENREQIELARFYEQLPKSTLIAINEYLEGQLVYRNDANGKGIKNEAIVEMLHNQDRKKNK